MNNKTIFYGNGINYLSKNPIGWNDLLKIMMQDQEFELKLLPNIMAYERIRLNWNKYNPKHLKTEISQLLTNQPSNKFYKDLLNIKCDNYITTNYDYAILKAFKELNQRNEIISNSSEDIYSIRRKTQLINQKDKHISQIWNIHGEIKKPKSIMLGLNHYSGSIAKISGYIKGTYDFTFEGKRPKIISIEEKLENNDFDKFSWIELFFNSNVHITGFSLDFSEIDLWWVLNKRVRLMEKSLISNKVYYYTKPIIEVKKDEIEIEKRKRELLKAFSVDVIEFSTKKGYPEYWNKVINRIKASR